MDSSWIFFLQVCSQYFKDLSGSETNLEVPVLRKSNVTWVVTVIPCFCLTDNEKTGSRDMIPMDELGPGKFSHSVCSEYNFRR